MPIRRSSTSINQAQDKYALFPFPSSLVPALHCSLPASTGRHNRTSARHCALHPHCCCKRRGRARLLLQLSSLLASYLLLLPLRPPHHTHSPYFSTPTFIDRCLQVNDSPALPPPGSSPTTTLPPTTRPRQTRTLPLLPPHLRLHVLHLPPASVRPLPSCHHLLHASPARPSVLEESPTPKPS